MPRALTGVALALVNLHVLYLGAILTDRDDDSARYGFYLLKTLESGIESVVLALLTVEALLTEAGGAGGDGAALFWSSLSLSALSMAYGFYGNRASNGEKRDYKGNLTDGVRGGRLLEFFACILVHLCWVLTSLGLLIAAAPNHLGWVAVGCSPGWWGGRLGWRRCLGALSSAVSSLASQAPSWTHGAWLWRRHRASPSHPPPRAPRLASAITPSPSPRPPPPSPSSPRSNSPISSRRRASSTSPRTPSGICSTRASPASRSPSRPPFAPQRADHRLRRPIERHHRH